MAFTKVALATIADYVEYVMILSLVGCRNCLVLLCGLNIVLILKCFSLLKTCPVLTMISLMYGREDMVGSFL